MRIAAGVLLIIVAVFNLVAGLGYAAGGAATSYVGSGALEEAMVEGAQQAVNDEGNEFTEEQRAQLQDFSTSGGSGELAAAGGGMFIFGLFLLALAGLLIAAAVFLFKGSKARFIMVVAALAILAEVIGIVITKSPGITNAVGVIGAVFALIAARQIAAAAGGNQDDEPAEA